MFESCVVCENKTYDVVARYGEPDVYEIAAGVTESLYWREWVRCSKCEFHYSRYSRRPEVFDEFYAKGYRDEDASWRQESSLERYRRIIALPPEQSETRIRFEWILRNCSHLKSSSRENWRALDIGGASGVFAAVLKENAWDVAVVDPSNEGGFIEEELNIPYFASPLEEMDGKEKFHFATMNYVLEHVTSPERMLRLAKHVLEPDGLLFIEVPDVSNFRYLPADHDIFNACHLWMFDKKSLEHLLDRTGFRMFAAETIKVLRGHRGLMIMAELNG